MTDMAMYTTVVSSPIVVFKQLRRSLHDISILSAVTKMAKHVTVKPLFDI